MIILDMDMPKECQDCQIHINEVNDDYGWRCNCNLDEKSRDINLLLHEKPSWCPIKCYIEDIKAEIKAIQVAEIQIYGKESWNFTGKCLDVIDEKIYKLGC